MRPKILVIGALVFLILIAGLVYWRSIWPVRKVAPYKKRVAVPAVKKKIGPKIAIVIDDFGYNMNNLEALFSIKEPFTLSILPHLSYSSQIASLARSRGYEVILHLPLEPHRKNVRQEVATINSGMSEKEIITRLEEDINDIEGLSGVSNHMGSKSTEERPLMKTILSHLNGRGLYFFDSLTSQRSVCQATARAVGIRFAKRDVFLDMGRTDDLGYIRKQILQTKRIALKKGYAIAVCHDRKDTIRVLVETMPQLSRDGIEFVYLSELIN